MEHSGKNMFVGHESLCQRWLPLLEKSLKLYNMPMIKSSFIEILNLRICSSGDEVRWSSQTLGSQLLPIILHPCRRKPLLEPSLTWLQNRSRPIHDRQAINMLSQWWPTSGSAENVLLKAPMQKSSQNT